MNHDNGNVSSRVGAPQVASGVVGFARYATSVGSSTVIGAGYGLIWWVLGALILMPAKLGMGLFVFNTMAWQSLMGHVAYGLLLGAVYAALLPRLSSR